MSTKSDQLKEKLLASDESRQTDERQDGAPESLQPLQNEEEGVAALTSSYNNLDSSRRSLNQYNPVAESSRERAFDQGIIVELSRHTSEAGDSRMSFSNGDEIDELLLDDDFSSRLINKAGGYQAVPNPYNPVLDSVVCKGDRSRTKWQEAALYIQEGENDAKFYHHPTNKWSKKAYDILHHAAYHVYHLLVCILLLLLVFAEHPAVGQDRLNKSQEKILISVHAVMELLLLALLGADIILRAFWFGCSRFLQHKRTIVITVILVVMYVEALTVIIRQSEENHIRITRVLRPIFILDTYYMGGVRRVLRQLVLSLRPILDVLVLLLFFIVLFALFGYLIFSEVDPDYFSSFSRAFVSLFITQTTANHPDVMMEAYGDSPASALFFIAYMIVTLYFAVNVLLAVMYSSFSKADKKKFKKLLFHKRDALRRAFQILGSGPDSDVAAIQFHDFLRFMHHYKPRIPEWQVMCIFKALHKNPQEQYQGLNLEEFYNFYDVINYRWNQMSASGDVIEWFTRFPEPVRKPLQALRIIVGHRVYKFFMGVIVLANLLFLIIFISQIKDSSRRFPELHRVLPVSFVFLSIYIVDVSLNIIGYGLYNYFRKFWNVADVIMILFSFLCLCLETNPMYQYLAIARPLKLLRLIRLKGRYRNLMNTLIELRPRFVSLFILFMIIYYAFAIIGLEFFAFKVEQGCCNTSWYHVGEFYSAKVDPPGALNDTNTPKVYYLNNFDNILRSYVTLFILMVVNNWYVIMEGFASESKVDWLARIYFMSFYIVSLVVLQVAISFIVEAFVFKIKAAERRQTCTKHPDSYSCSCNRAKKKTTKITLVEEDIAKLRYEIVYLDEQEQHHKLSLNKLIKRWRRIDLADLKNQSVKFQGRRPHTKEDIHSLMYKDEIKHWITYKQAHHSQDTRARSKTTFKLAAKRTVKKISRKVLNYILD